MKDERRFETLLRESLDRSGQPPPFSIDVADRVMARIATLGPPPRAEVGARQFARWAVAASIVGAALAIAAFGHAPTGAGMIASLEQALAGATETAIKLYAPAGALAGTMGRVALALVASVQTLVSPLTPFQPLARVMLTAIAAAMLGITTFVVGRDVRARAPRKEHS